MSTPDFSTPEAMRSLLERAVKYAGQRSISHLPRWSHVSSLFCHGSGYSIAICKEFGVDPDEMVGGELKDGAYCPSCFCQCQSHEYGEHEYDCEVGLDDE